MIDSDLFYKSCWCDFKAFLNEIVEEDLLVSVDPEEWLGLMDRIERKYGAVDE